MTDEQQQPIPEVTQAVADSNASTSASLSTAIAQDSAPPASLSTSVSTAQSDPADVANTQIATLVAHEQAEPLTALVGDLVVNEQPAPTDSVTGSPTGGPIAGEGATPDAKSKHGLLQRLENDLRAELRAVEELPEHVLHVLAAVFDRHHSTVDIDAAQ